ncbi:addiction module killer protein [Scytonema hofmannii PCC 7110]|uniref:Addiction module killer protein n=1 Tax=Scytonema hofmannii PCC 7110 TaxID=128403 RepID=A0A139X3I4_9CYAN|nr:type II toxin-antitoxin system RelE/ParE family toxin [Scytonema hofmannii]KYC39269.1 addiction module killer protein [Scytonema hofmannii PCC 7110]
MEAHTREIRRYMTADGKIPFAEWFDGLRDNKAISKINSRIKRVTLGNLGDYRSIGEGVCELKIDCGPGYRIYFGQIGITIILLLCGGDKSTQAEDIRKAKEYWEDYEKRQNAYQ